MCGVGVVRSMSLGCEWMCCGAGCGVVWVPFPLFFLSLFLNFLLLPLGWVCWCVWLVRLGWECVDVWAGWQSLLIDVAAPQRGDQVKQVSYKRLG